MESFRILAFDFGARTFAPSTSATMLLLIRTVFFLVKSRSSQQTAAASPRRIPVAAMSRRYEANRKFSSGTAARSLRNSAAVGDLTSTPFSARVQTGSPASWIGF
jgi:hypothetical protein